KRNYLIERVAGTRNNLGMPRAAPTRLRSIHGDRELRYQGRPTTFSSPEIRHEHNLWDVEKVQRLAANQDDEVTFFCGSSRNFKQFIDLFDEIFSLDVDAETLNEQLDSRPDDWARARASGNSSYVYTPQKKTSPA